MNSKLFQIPDKVIVYSFYLLFFLVPLILTPFNYELFEYNKMMLTYGLTVAITGTWIIKMILKKQFFIAQTPLDISLLLFLLSQIISTIFSLDRHVSIWGYYSRFNGGLLSTISYILLYYAFVSNFPKKKIINLLLVALGSGLIVSLYGIAEHFGIDKHLWIQDVQNRVFSTLGQPNWLAAYLAVLSPIGIALATLNVKYQISNTYIKNQKKLTVAFYLLSLIFYLCLLFTKSRSGFLGFWLANGVFWALFLPHSPRKIHNFRPRFCLPPERWLKGWLKSFLIINFSLLTLTFIFGSPFTQIDQFTLPKLMKPEASQTQPTAPPITGSIIDVGVTESGRIRKIVWKGAVDVFKNFPLTGSGIETFAFSYYLFRPVEHNMTSEWDFLYNKAHNEYLNYAATTGILGLGSYLIFIGGFVWWSLKKLKVKSEKLKITVKNSKLLENIKLKTLTSDFGLWTLDFGLLAGFSSILVTNFFGFSVVIIQLFFFLVPAILFTSYNNLFMRYIGTRHNDNKKLSFLPITNYQLLPIILVLSTVFYLLFAIVRLWYADTLFAQGYNLQRTQQYLESYQNIKKATSINANEPLYYDELVIPSAQLALAAYDNNQSTLSAQLTQQAIDSSNRALLISPNNVNFWKTRTRLFYILAQSDEKYLSSAYNSLDQAKLLSPTDPKIRYNLGVLNLTLGKEKEAIEELHEASRLKPDYRDAFYAKGIYYKKVGDLEKAKEAFDYILEYINPEDEEVKKRLEEKEYDN